MVKHTALILTASLMAIGVSSSASAQGAPRGPVPVQKVLQSFRTRIQQGVKGGGLTPAERKKLQEDVQAVRKQAQAMRQSGTKPTPAQRQQLRQGLSRINKMIARLRHNKIRRHGGL